MIASKSQAMEPVRWEQADGGDAGLPLSPRFGQAYRSRSGALAQARAVFLQGCGLPEGWRGAQDFAVLELGFGLGLNFLATWAAWLADPHRSARLHYLALEAYPVAADDLLRSARVAVQEPGIPAGAAPRVGMQAAAWTRQDELLERLARQLAVVWPTLRPGLQTWTLADEGSPPARLTLALGDVTDMLAALAVQPQAQAVYLDGFSPAVNPAMWSPAVLHAVAERCAPGARLATYSAARAVRDTLSGCGFEVWRCPGLPPKRHRLEAVLRPPDQDLIAAPGVV
jgi:tRNA U34 5-methylaminomethyl-2-thiouridine-forming methyltransferase MnmC